MTATLTKSHGTTKDTYCYHFKVGNRIVYRGITSDLARREAEHKERWPDGHIRPIGKPVTREAAYDWQRRGGKSIG